MSLRTEKVASRVLRLRCTLVSIDSPSVHAGQEFGVSKRIPAVSRELCLHEEFGAALFLLSYISLHDYWVLRSRILKWLSFLPEVRYFEAFALRTRQTQPSFSLKSTTTLRQRPQIFHFCFMSFFSATLIPN
jgi:hypothetical protein